MMTYTDWRANIIAHVRRIGDATRQRRAWTQSGPPMADWIELVCIFDDLEVREFIKRRPTLITPRDSLFYDGLEQLADRIDLFCNTHPDELTAEAILQDSEWQGIQQLAAKVAEDGA